MLVQFVRLVLGLFGLGGPKIEAARQDGKMPWSTTVVNINRQRNKRANRIKLLVVAVICLGACFACSMYAWLNSNQKPMAVSANPTATRLPQPTATRLPPTHTPQPPTPTAQVARPLIDVQASMPITRGVIGQIIDLNVEATQDGVCTVWWDNEIPIARTQTAGGRVVMAFGVPSTPPGKHLVIVEVSAGYSLDRVVIPFTVE